MSFDDVLAAPCACICCVWPELTKEEVNSWDDACNMLDWMADHLADEVMPEAVQLFYTALAAVEVPTSGIGSIIFKLTELRNALPVIKTRLATLRDVIYSRMHTLCPGAVPLEMRQGADRANRRVTLAARSHMAQIDKLRASLGAASKRPLSLAATVLGLHTRVVMGRAMKPAQVTHAFHPPGSEPRTAWRTPVPHVRPHAWRPSIARVEPAEREASGAIFVAGFLQDDDDKKAPPASAPFATPTKRKAEAECPGAPYGKHARLRPSIRILLTDAPRRVMAPLDLNGDRELRTPPATLAATLHNDPFSTPPRRVPLPRNL